VSNKDRKRSHLRVIQGGRQTDGGSQVDHDIRLNEPLGASDSEPDAPSEVFERVFQALRALTPDGDLMIALCSPLSHSCKVEWSSGNFSTLQQKSLDVSHGIFAQVLGQSDPVQFKTNAELSASEIAFTALPEGAAAIFRVDLAGDLLALITYWQAKEHGALSQERVRGLRLVAELAAEAACASDLSLDVQAQQLHLETLRTEIQEVQHFYRQFSDAIKQCFWVLDVDNGQVIVVSDNFERVWGADKNILHEGLTGFMTSVLPADRDRVLAEFHHNLGGEVDTEFRVIDEEGEVRWIWLRVFPTRDHLGNAESAGQSRRVVLIADDVSEKKTEEESVRAREAELVTRARALAVGDLASGVAHEINNPLTIVVGKAAEVKRLLNKPEPDIKAALEATEKIQRTSMRISEIVMSLKSLARKDRVTIAQNVPLAKVFVELRDMVSEKFKMENVRLEMLDAPATLFADMNATLISQVLLNLVNNAFDAAQAENDKWVKVEFAEDADSVYVFITDSGAGIPIKNRSRIFDPFFTTKEPGKGTGLGLSLAANIAAHHHGALRLDTLHPYTRFVLQIPRTQPAPVKAVA
jgi:PAS domain S-box-containing protein